MARLHPETALSHRPRDVAMAPDLKTGVAPSLLGVFDEALRQARQSERDPIQESSTSSRDTRPVDEPRPSSQTDEREDYETERASSDNTDDVPASDAVAGPSDEVEADERETDTNADSEAGTDTESVPTSDKSAEDPEVEDDGIPSDETATDSVVPDQIPVEQLIVGEIEQTASEGDQAEQVSSSENVAEKVEKVGGAPTADSQPAEVTVGQLTGEPGVEEATITTEAVDETQEDSGEESESESKPKPPVVESQKHTEAIDGTDSPDKPVGDKEAKPGEDLQSEPRAKGREKPTHRERREAATTQSNDGQAAPADAGRPVQATASVGESQLQDTLVASETLPTAESSVADPGTTNNASQLTGAADGVTLVDSRASAAQNQAEAVQGSSKGTGPGVVDPAKFIQRVAQAFTALGQRSGPVRLKLYPPELGSLRMEITVKNGTLSAKVEAETAAAKGVLLENLPLLRERLVEQGIKIDRFDVGVSDQPHGGPSERSDDGDRSRRYTNREDESTQARGDDTDLHEEPRSRSLAADGRLDVLI